MRKSCFLLKNDPGLLGRVGRVDFDETVDRNHETLAWRPVNGRAFPFSAVQKLVNLAPSRFLWGERGWGSYFIKRSLRLSLSTSLDCPRRRHHTFRDDNHGLSILQPGHHDPSYPNSVWANQRECSPLTSHSRESARGRVEAQAGALSSISRFYACRSDGGERSCILGHEAREGKTAGSFVSRCPSSTNRF